MASSCFRASLIVSPLANLGGSYEGYGLIVNPIVEVGLKGSRLFSLLASFDSDWEAVPSSPSSRRQMNFEKLSEWAQEVTKGVVVMFRVLFFSLSIC